MGLLKVLATFILLVFITIGLKGQQNPFDVYRTSNPDAQQENLTGYSMPKNQIIQPESNSISKEPERMAALTINRDSSDRTFENPFDVYAPRENTASIPNPLHNPDLDKSEGDVIGEIKSFEDNPEKIEIKENKVTKVPETTIHEVQDEILLNNPFDVSDEVTSREATAESKNPINSPDQYDIVGEPKQAVSEIESALPKDQKVKGYFNNLLTNYVFWILLGFLVLLTFVININRKLIPEISKSLISDNYLRITYREYNKGFTQFLSYLLYLNFFVQAGLFTYLAQKPLFGEFTWPWYYFVGGAFGIYMIRHIVLMTLGSFFPVHRETSQFSFVIMQFNLFIGLILFGLNWLLAFGITELSKPLIFIGLSTVVLLYLIRQFRGLLLGARIVSHYKFHFFLYLCAVEFAPILMLYKVVVESFS